MTTTPHDNTAILPPLALALVNHPRATLQELAKAIGISKATLYRFCPTRDLLIKRLLEQSLRTLDEALDRERDLMRELGFSADYREGVAAFTEKRKAVFVGS